MLRSTGVTRNVDDLGRIVIPKEIRRTMGIENRDPVEFLLEDNYIAIRKFTPNKACVVTGKVSDDNFQVGDIWLSEEGADLLMKKMENRAEKK
ncbi:AbrB/MazE/SpoVT family DNA-binding domain-containing protein [Virgibacillus xinjiangensis]|uniref:AbrB/MazE/SpoVT family DNA-binding domain-containing protein n=1 Tax=Virgibacillus xinjiangensis TaxID=393090 RepID=A0ABV7CWL6_9BACI